MIVEAAVKLLAKTPEGNLNFKLLVTLNENSSVQSDDFLLGEASLISLKKADQAFTDLPETLKISGNETQKIELTKGSGIEDLLILMPQNKFTFSDLVQDAQAQILKPVF